MTPLARKSHAFVKVHGGKFYLARRIIAHFPVHTCYVEPFAGGLSCLLNKPEVAREVAIDSNPFLIGVWEYLKSYPLCLQTRLGKIDATREGMESAFEQARSIMVSPADRTPMLSHKVDAFLIANRMSRGGFGMSFAWQRTRERGGRPAEVNSWLNFVDSIPELSRRVRRVEFACRDAIRVLGSFDDRNSLIYADPPYYPDTRTHKKSYGRFDMDATDHRNLLDVLCETRARVVLSGYRNPLYDMVLSCWNRVDFDMPNHSSQSETKSRRVESIWIK